MSRISGKDTSETLVGGTLSDALYGNLGDDVLRGLSGDDLLVDGGGNDTLRGGGGDDLLYSVAGTDIFDGGGGAADTLVDQFYGILAGSEVAFFDMRTRDHGFRSEAPEELDTVRKIENWHVVGAIDVQAVGDGRANLFRTDRGNDLIAAGRGADTIESGDGNDSIRGGKGNDLLEAGAGDDDLKGDIGDDRLVGGAGNDRVFGGAGADVIVDGAGDDTLTGNAGADDFVFVAEADGIGANLVRDMNTGNDRLILSTALWDYEVLTPEEVIDRFGQDAAGGAVLDFGEAGSIQFKGVSDVDTLLDDLFFA